MKKIKYNSSDLSKNKKFPKVKRNSKIKMFHRFPFLGLGFLVFFCLQVEIIQGSSPSPPQQNVPSSYISQQNISAFPFGAAATVWRIPLRHPNATLLLKALWAIQEQQNMEDAGRGYRLISIQREGLVDVTPALPSEFTHKVYLSRNNNNNNSFFCGGSIISKWLILTAAHCVVNDDDELNASSLMVTAGLLHGHPLSRPSGLEQILVVDEIVVHPNYTRGGGEHQDNIAILVLKEPLTFSAAVRSIGLPNPDCIFWGNATVSGWGSMGSSGDPSLDALNKVTVAIIPSSQCNSQYYASSNVRITEQMFCAEEEGLVSCQGDGGGPAVCRSGGWGLQRSSVLCGIVSLREGGCRHVDYPGVYVQVSKYISWISETLKNLKLENHNCLLDGDGDGISSPSNGTGLSNCVSKYLLPERGTRQHGVEEEEPGFLLLANRTSLLRIDVNRTEHRTEQLPMLGSAFSRRVSLVDFDLRNNILYWVDNNNEIKRLYVNGNNGIPEVLLSLKGSSRVFRGLAFDWISGNLYFTCSNEYTIEVIRTNGGTTAIHGRMRKRLLTTPDVRFPRDLAVHPEKGYIFWTDSDSIGRAHLDGSHATKIVSNGSESRISVPSGLTLDFSEDRIYWADSKLDLLMSADLNGGDVKIVLQSDARISAPQSVGIYKNIVYWTDSDNKGLFKAPLRDDKTVRPNSIVKIIGGLGFPSHMKMYGGGSQRGENLCFNSSCRYICLASSAAGSQRSLSCLCPDGLSCQNDTMEDGVVTTPSNEALTKGVTITGTPPCGAKQDPRLLFVINGSSVLRMDLNQMSLEKVPLGGSSVVEADPSCVEFDLKGNILFWVDSGKTTIKRLHLLNGSMDPEVLVSSSNVSQFTGLTFDWMSRILYFTDARKSTIEVIRTDNSLSPELSTKIIRKRLLKRPYVRKPTGIAVHPANGYIFWTDWDENSPQNSFIGRAHLDGSSAMRIVVNDNSGGKNNNNTQLTLDSPTGITLDYTENRIYWVDSRLGRMMTADLNGNDVKIVLQADARISEPNSVAIYESTVYWTDRNAATLFQAPLQHHNKTIRPSSISRVIGGGLVQSRGMKVYGGWSQQGENFCTHSNCSYICMASSPGPNQTVACICPDGFTKRNEDTASRQEDTLSTDLENVNVINSNNLPVAGTTSPCEVQEEEEGFLLVTNGTSVLRIDLDLTMSVTELFPVAPSSSENDYPRSPEFDAKNNCLYWIDSNGSIKRLNMNRSSSSHPEILVSSNGSSRATDLAFDWMSRNLYFISDDGKRRAIKAVRTDQVGSAFHGGVMMRKTLMTKPDVNRPRGIAVHPAKGYIFWTDESFIGRAHLDGSHAIKILSSRDKFKTGSSSIIYPRYVDPILHSPRGITVDYSEDRIYWVDSGSGVDRMVTADLNGGDAIKVLQADNGVRSLMAGRPLGVYKDTVYWTDRKTEGLYTAPLRQHKTTVRPKSAFKIMVVVDQYFSPRDLRVYGRGGSSQQGENLCTHSNCSYICVVSPGPERELSCLCPDGFISQLNNNNNNNDTEEDEQVVTPSTGADLLTKCVPEPEIPLCGVEEDDPGLLFVTNGTSVLKIDFNQTGRPGRVVQGPTVSGGATTPVEFDLKTNYLYWVEHDSKRGSSIKRLHMNGNGHPPEVLFSSRSLVTDLAFDWMSGNLYFTQFGFSTLTIEVINTDNVATSSTSHQQTMRKSLLKNYHADEPSSGMAVHPEKGYIFWAQCWRWWKKCDIRRARLDGSNKTSIVSTGEVGTTLFTVDHSADRFYWIDLGLMNRIQSADLNGGDVKIVLQSGLRISGLSNPASFGVYKNTLYWTDAETEELYRAPLQDDKTVRPETKCRVLLEGLTNPTILKVYGAASQQGENVCTNSNSSSNNCSFICMVSPGPGPQQSASCLCPDGFTKQNDTTCV